MKILLTGANGYIGKRLLPQLVQNGHEVWCCVREPHRFAINESIRPHIHVLQIDFLDTKDAAFPPDIDAAYFLIHSMTGSKGSFQKLEEETARNFVRLANQTHVKQIVYLGGLANSDNLSEHLKSRVAVEEILKTAISPVTILRAGIIVGSGSASYEIIRDLVEKLPLMITPKWLNTRCQPIGVRNILDYLEGVLGKAETHNQTFDVGGPEILTYKQMLLQFAEVRGLKRYIGIIPIMTPKLSSYWLYFVTNTSYNLAVNLVKSVKIDVVCRDNRIHQLIPTKLLSYKEAVELAFVKIEQNAILSSWKDAYNYRGRFDPQDFVQVPKFGVFSDHKEIIIKPEDVDRVKENVFAIGGDRGWYYANWLWRIRGVADKIAGGSGLRRGRTNPKEVFPGNALDFWRVIVAEKSHGRLLLFAEMKLPGDAWLEFKITKKGQNTVLNQTATFRPSGLLGRLYWLSVLPFHHFIFRGMINKLAQYKASK